ncbi:hypothetical protein GE09DRAFT_730682 [Coniochaeta sp. 2T2.1]|nr:hypothetical protein GE09DRAFT_730682 [Coniochaeta sp. 2T2.1]
MARTRSGCWTCRLRTKKKCDEATPTCQRCSRLGVKCFGYEARPSQEELNRDRRALISTVGSAARTDNSNFRVWRLKPTANRQQSEQRQIEQRQQDESAGSSPGNGTIALTALDRVNSGYIDFLHPQFLVDYTDKVFWKNSRFYHAPGPYNGNSWMKAFLVRSQKTQLAAALMGLTYSWIYDKSRLVNINVTQALSVLHSLVVQGVSDQLEKAQDLAATDDVLSAGAILAKCATILLIFEVSCCPLSLSVTGSAS